MKYLALVGLVIVAMVWITVEFVFQFLQGDSLRIIPLLGIAVIDFILYKTIKFIVFNIDEITIGMNILFNTVYFTQKSLKSGSSEMAHALNELAMEPKKFKIFY